MALPTNQLRDGPPQAANSLSLPERLLLGTSSFSSKDWLGVFYPRELKPAEFIGFYASRYPAVEIDATFYAVPAKRTVEGWRDRTPAGFRFAAKVPQTITHEKMLADCDAELAAFLRAMETLGERLGPLLLQFPYYRKADMPGPGPLLARLEPFLKRLPSGFRFAVEVRNKNWIAAELLAMLRSAGVALALIDHPWMERPEALLRRIDPVTTDFVYIRWLGDRHGIEETTRTWDRIVVDRTFELTEWSAVVRELLTRKLTVYGFANNHYAGHAPATLEQFAQLLACKPEPGPSARRPRR